jgi:pilus assembly protein CpaB
VVNAVTLELLPMQAEMLDLARSVGTLSLVLRNQTDPNAVATSGITKSELLGQARQQPAPVKPAEPVPPAKVVRRAHAAPAPAPTVVVAAPIVRSNCVEVIRGLSKVNECF